MFDYEKVKRWVDAIQDQGRGLSEWEESFVDSCIRQFKAKGSLSDKQCDILERIYSERTPTGSRFGEEGSKTTRVRTEGRNDKSWRDYDF